jgi:hypothetical protein
MSLTERRENEPEKLSEVRKRKRQRKTEKVRAL